MLKRLFITLGLIAALAACRAEETLENAISGSGETHDYAALELELALPADHAVAVTVIDRRPYVVDGGESPRFVGTGPGRYHNTVDVATASGRPLAELLTEAIGRALERQVIAASAVPLPEGTEPADAHAALAASPAERFLVVEIREWQANTQIRVAARWHLEATVYDRAGNVLGRRSRQGAETLGTAGMSQHAGPLAVEALSGQLTLLLTDQSIAEALRRAPAPA